MRFHLPLLLAASGLLPLLASAQTTPGFERLPSGIAYKLYRRDAARHYQRYTLTRADTAGYKSRVGKLLLAHIEYRTGKDSVLQNSRKALRNHPVPLPLLTLTMRGGQEEALSLLHPGDSAVFRFSASALLRGEPVPPELKRGGNVLVMRVVAMKLITSAEATRLQPELQAAALAEQQRQQQASPQYQAQVRTPAAAQARQVAQPATQTQLKTDDAAIQAYLREQHLTTATKLPGGVYYLITKPGTGPVARAGQVVTVRYSGSLLSGKVFDSSAKHGGQPISFVLGQGQVIPGWDQGLSQLSKGSKAVLLIPSGLAYGKTGSPPSIPANAPLRFEVELLDSK
ncbi:MAG: FKBP-type peptidyl-prolyl cis-trans isomerase [Janthinobacterium lividum]